ncbi:hypothetical protein GQ42DRAFT_139492 [Ramicandelaber brevisporus]|nr:hypothetical protein GQ42DRAFT_139492 [Ramicandelaber brevisporus]
MQGWAKRWFEIDRGVMSYSMEPGGIQRGSIHLPMAAVSTNPVQLTITVDSGATLFQIKALDRPDYEKWVGALKISNGAPAVELQRQSTSSQRTSSVVFSGSAGAAHGLSNLANIVSLHQRTITEGHTSFGVEATRIAQLLDVLESQLSEASIVPLASTTPTPTATANTTATAASGISQSSGRSGRKGISSFFSSRPRESTTPVPASSTPPSLPSSGAIFSAEDDEEFYDANEMFINEEEDTISDYISDADGDAATTDFGDDDDDGDNDDDDEGDEDDDDREETGRDIVRRIKLPSPVFCEPPSIVSILRKNVGRDLFSVSMPVALNEPLNVLQHLCEELEHSYLLDRAATLCDSLERMIFIAAFAISPCAATAFRSSRKPYNPLHGETYECLRPDKGFRFLAEKISHAPPIMACHASSLTASGFGSWEFYQESRAKNKFWGKSMEFIQGGTVHIKLSGWNDHYTFTKPSMWVRNMMSATSRSIEYSGDVVVRNHTTGDVCTIRFKESGYFSSSNNEVTAKIERGKKPLGSSPTPPSSMIVVPANGGGTPATRTLAGRWSENLKPVVVDGLGGGDVIWAAHPIPHDPNTYYGFTQFAMELNELVPDIEGTGGNLLPRTDTRLRPDQRMLERGDLDGAEKEKARLETRQRERRKEIEDSGKAWKPRWFVVKKDDNDIGNQDETTWRYAGGYWEAREKHNFGNDILELW